MPISFEAQLEQLNSKLEAIPVGRRINLHFQPLPHQREVFWRGDQNIVYVKGRRAGGTFGAAGRIMELLLKHRGRKALWIDTGHKNMLKAIRRIILPMLKDIPERAWRFNQQEMSLALWNGSYLDFGSAENPEGIEGWGYDNIVVNEAGIVLKDEKLYYNTLVPMGIEGTGAQWFFVGTPKGKGLFHQLYLKGLLGEDGWVSFKHPSSINKFVNTKLLERLARTMPTAVRQQELFGDFLEDGESFFLNLQGASSGAAEGEWIFGEQYSLGVDVAKKEDYTVVWVVKHSNRKGIWCERWNKTSWPETVARIKTINDRFHAIQLVLDATGIGDVVMDDLNRLGVGVVPVIFTQAVKNALCSNLAADIENGNFSFFRHEITIAEMEAFQRIKLPSGSYRVQGPNDQHDDCVIALALARHALGPAPSSLFGVETFQGIGARDAMEDLARIN